jgi:tyrosine-protein kinase Etk/Wzc
MLSEQLLIKSQSVAERVANRIGMRLRIVHPVVSRGEVFGDSVPLVDSTARNGEYLLSFRGDGVTLSSGGTQLGTAAYNAQLRASGLTLVVPQRPAFKEKSVVLAVIPLASAAAAVRGAISTRSIPQTDVVEITFRGGDPVIVRDAANAVAKSYAEFSSEMQLTNARNKTDFILRSLADQKREVDAAQTRLQAFKESHQTSDVTAEIASLFEGIHKFEGERRDALVEQAVYKQLLGKLSQADTADEDLRRLAGTEAITRNAYVASLYTRWYDLLKTREEIMAGGKSEAYADIKGTDKLITRTKNDLQSASRLYLEGVESRLRSFDQTIAELRTQAERYPPLESEQARLLADVRTAQKTYDDLLSQYQLARIAQSADGATVRMVDAAVRPSFAVSPNRRRAILFASFLGLALGIALAIGIERLDDSVKSPDELVTRLQLPVLGQIPAIRVAKRDVSHELPLNRLVSHVDPRSVVAEAYRSLRTNLAFARAQSRLRTIVLTSPGPADGKSTTAANLAITFAQQGQKTLLVDADLRRAVLDKTFSVPRTPGLTDVIVGVASFEQGVHATSVENLFVMGSGQLPPNPSELLGSARMKEVLAQARDAFDIVLFDSPPLLAVTDAAVLSTIVDGAILVVRTGSTTREAVRRAVTLLRNVHSRLLGAVLNDIDFKSGSYYGGYGYYYYQYDAAQGQENGAPHGFVDRLRGLVGRDKESR